MPVRNFSFSGTSYVLDARPDRLDIRDRAYLPPVISLPARYPADSGLHDFVETYVAHGLVLDQGREGACTGFGLAATVNYLFWRRAIQSGETNSFKAVSPHMFYDLAQFYDEWPGEEYEGSSCRGAMKGWHKHGVCDATMWQKSVRAKIKPRYVPNATWSTDATSRPVGVYYRVDHRSVTDMQSAIVNMGAIFVSSGVHAGWEIKPKRSKTKQFIHANLPVIAYNAGDHQEGAHAFAIVGYNDNGFIVQNSWGERWGCSGFAIMTYQDWVAHGSDAWVCSLGVPQHIHGFVGATPRTARNLSASLLAGDSKVSVKPSNPAVVPWSNDRAYDHTVVAGNNGEVRRTHPNVGYAAEIVNAVAYTPVKAWLASEGKSSKRIVIYTHGGLNNEDGSIERARVLGPYFLANGIYPIFYAWRTGLFETIGSKFDDIFGSQAEGRISKFLKDRKDLGIELIAHKLRWIWNEMKDNAEGGLRKDRAISLLAAALAKLSAEDNVEIHLVGHSAGSFVHGHLIQALIGLGVQPTSLTLYAPACSLAFALKHFVQPVEAGILAKNKFWLHILSDQNEQDDSVGPYGKSLLYLVARGFEDVRKTPSAGLAHTIDPTATDDDDDQWKDRFWGDVQTWRAFVASLPKQKDGVAACEIVTAKSMHTGQQRYIPAAHGAFDNGVDVVSRTINRVLGQSPGATLVAPVEDLNY